MIQNQLYENDIYYNFCHINDRNIIELKHIYLKKIFSKTANANIIQHMIYIIENSLQISSQIVVDMDLTGITLIDIDKYKYFIQEASIILKHKFPDILNVCYIKNAPFVFSQLIKLFGLFIDKKTQKKMILVDNEIAHTL
jgi:hypothetical protein